MDQDKLVLNIDGEDKVYDVYYSLTCPQTNKGYITYSEHQIDADGNEVVLVSSYDPNKKDELQPVTDPQEMDLVKSVYEKIRKIA